MTATESAPVNTGLRSLLQTVRKTIIGSLNLSRTGGCAGLLRFSTTWKVEGAADADPPHAHYKFSFTTPSRCSLAQGALVGTSVAASLALTSLFSIRQCSTPSPLLWASL